VRRGGDDREKTDWLKHNLRGRQRDRVRLVVAGHAQHAARRPVGGHLDEPGECAFADVIDGHSDGKSVPEGRKLGALRQLV
jgi:hypothetical protein